VADVVQGWQRDWESGNEFIWVVTEFRADRAIGAVSYSGTGSEVTFSYVLNRAYWERGYATELAVRLVEHLFVDPELLLIRATCDEENVASRTGEVRAEASWSNVARHGASADLASPSSRLSLRAAAI
jgi:RimJ/RimL family protein N-acetyltransferase